MANSEHSSEEIHRKEQERVADLTKTVEQDLIERGWSVAESREASTVVQEALEYAKREGASREPSASPNPELRQDEWMKTIHLRRDGGGISRKPRNLVVNWRDLVWVGARAAGPLITAHGVALMLRAAKGLFEVEIDKREALVLLVLWGQRSRSAQPLSRLAPRIHRAFERKQLGPPSETELAGIIDRLDRLDTITRFGDHIKLKEQIEAPLFG